MPMEITHAGNPEVLNEALENLFPDHTPEDIAKAAGAVDGSKVELYSGDHNHIGVHFDHPHIEGFRNFQKIYPPKKPSQIVITHEAQTARGPLLGKGYKRFAEQIKHLHKLKVNRIVVGSGAGSKGAAENGFITWPKLGFNGEVGENQIATLPPELQAKLNEPGKNDFHTLFSLPGGPKAWEEVGTSTGRLHFDLTPGSEHLKRFENYYADRERREAAKQSAAQGVPGPESEGAAAGGGASFGPEGVAGGTAKAPETSRLDERLSRGLRGIKKLSRLRGLLLQFKRSKFCCTMVPLEGEAADKIKAMGESIPDEDLGEDGRETDPHITLLYGLHDSDPAKVKKLLSRIKRPIQFKLGKVSLFPGEDAGKDYDVVKVEVHSPDLHQLNKLLKTLPHTDNWPEYKPHATIGYVKKGLGTKYQKQFGELNLTGASTRVIFSDRDKKHTPITVANKKVKMSRSEQPLKFELTPPVHPLVRGFRIAHALKAIAKSPEASTTSKQLALDVLHNGRTESLWGLHDSLLEDNHPLAHKEENGKLVSGYNWNGAIPKLHLDSAVGKLLDAIQLRLTDVDMPPDRARALAHNYARMANSGSRRDFLPGGGFVDPEANAASVEGFKILHDQGHDQTSLNESLNRHGVRDRDLGVIPSIAKPSAEEVREEGINPQAPTYASDRATRYKRIREIFKFGRTPTPKRGDFLSALKRVQSQQQGTIRTIAKQIYQKLHLNPATIRDSIHDTVGASSAGSAHALYHDSDPEKTKYAAAVYGLITQSPSLMVFHTSHDGPDSVHRFSIPGSGENIRNKLDQFGIDQRVFLPSKTGWDVLVYSKDGQLDPNVKAFSQAVGTPVKTAKGVGEVIGGGDNSSADSDSRRNFRSVIRGYEAKHNPKPQGNNQWQSSAPQTSPQSM